jgi:acyl transferase domain-containing protein/acyl carrier protein
MANASLGPLEQAFAVIRQLEERNARLEAASDIPVAVTGLACRLPGAPDWPAFVDLLRRGESVAGEPPPARLRRFKRNPEATEGVTTFRGGYLDDVDSFDPEFFGVAARETAEMDPQQRLALEVGWEALVDAGHARDTLRASRTGVFLGMSQNDYGRRVLDARRSGEISAYAGTGTQASAAAGRIAYCLGLEGPCMTVDTACSSSLTAIHLAVRALRYGECDLALCGGVQLNLFPETFLFLSKAQALASDGISKTFDASANGYGRGEGCGMLVLERLSDARAARRAVRAAVRGTAINHDGSSSGFTVPNGMAQRALLHAALRDARLQPEQVQFVEAHGTGTLLGDPIEVEAIGEVYAARRTRKEPLFVGSVKANVGHLEAAAGVAGAIKMILAMEGGFVPKQPHFNSPNPHIPWERYAMRVPRETSAWAGDAGFRRAAVSAFGMSGSNAHVVLERELASAAPVWKPVSYRRRRFWIAEPSVFEQEIVRSPLLDGVLVKRTLLASDAVLADHRIHGSVAVPGAYYLAMAASIYRETQAGPCRFSDVVFPEALTLGDEAVDLHLRLTADTLRVASQRGERTTVHAEARIVPAGSTPSAMKTAAERAGVAVADGFYERLERRNIGLGAAFRWLEGVVAQDGVAWARIKMSPEFTNTRELAPGLVDGCFQLLSALMPENEATYVPLGIADCWFSGSALRVAAWCRAVRSSPEENAPADIDLFDAAGEPLLTMRGVRLRLLGAARANRLAYRVEWVPLCAAANVSSPGRWLLLGDDGELSARLHSLGCFRAVARDRDEALKLLEQSWEKIVFLRTSAENGGAPDLASVMALAEVARHAKPGGLVVAAAGLAVSGTLGLARTIAMEQPELKVSWIDLGDSTGRLDERVLIDPISRNDSPAWYRIRRGQCESAHLVRSSERREATFEVRPGTTCLIVGGTGGVGGHLARWLASRGAQHLVLAGRERHPLPELPASCEARWEQLDVRNAAAVDRLVARLAQSARPLAGLIHAAGVREDRTALALTRPQAEEVFGAKAHGAWNLHEATRGVPLDFAVWVSSAAGLLGSPGQAAYAAANAYVDALVEHRRRLGLTAASIAWGPWDETGMAGSLSPAQHQIWKRRGIVPLAPKDALAALGALLSCGEQYLMAIDADWRRFSEAWGTHPPTLLDALVPRATPSAPTPPWQAPRAAELRDLAALRELVASQAREVLLRDRDLPGSMTFFDAGMDSLMALELRNRLQAALGANLPATLVFDYPNIEALAGALHERMNVSVTSAFEEVSEDELERMLLDKMDRLERSVAR